jgi:SAM-dependent methyltransferase
MYFEDWAALYQFQRNRYGALRGLLRTLRPDLRRTYSRGLVKKYTRDSDHGLEIGAGEQTIAPFKQTILSDAFATHAGEKSLAQEFFPAEKIPYADETFDFLLNEHVLEHLPDAIRALNEWQRVLKSSGKLFLFLPHPERTFDRFRKVTQIEHFYEDFKNQVDSSEDQHWDEWNELVIQRGLAPHYAQYGKNESLDNNLIHRHVFTPASATALLKELGWTVLESNSIVPDRSDSFVLIAQK